jgi:hypothetical protein
MIDPSWLVDFSQYPALHVKYCDINKIETYGCYCMECGYKMSYLPKDKNKVEAQYYCRNKDCNKNYTK